MTISAHELVLCSSCAAMIIAVGLLRASRLGEEQTLEIQRLQVSTAGSHGILGRCAENKSSKHDGT